MTIVPTDKIALMNDLGNRGIPFLFVVDFDGSEVCVWRKEEIPDWVRFSVPMHSEPAEPSVYSPGGVSMNVRPVPECRYEEAFNKVMYHLRRGDTYLINLTMPTDIEISLTLEEIYRYSNAPYRLLFGDRFVCFSPEIFIRINDGVISSFPMKGTIDASVAHAEEKILASEKEFAEHNTIVDLIRNDLSMVAEGVRVKRYRYIDRIMTSQRELLQVSSEITGILPEGRGLNIGTILSLILPAGSVTGAPKLRTVEILKEAEGYSRGFYTGVFGYFDGRNLDSGVMIRFIEKTFGRMIYKSGGGITTLSNMRSEYEELIQKVYVPFT